LTADRPAEREELLRLGAAWAAIARNPYEYLIRRWNWKSAVISAILRGAIFFSTNLSAGRDAAIGAMLTEFGYRALLSGALGSVTQALRMCRPYWAATLTALVVLPAFSHTVEFIVHSLRGTPRIITSVSVSIGFSMATVLFNLYAMRRGVLIVNGERHRTLLEDLAMMPRIIAGFVAAGPLALWRFAERYLMR
jgi:hypothetical protein